MTLVIPVRSPPAGLVGFVPALGLTASGLFADGHSLTVNVPAGGLGTRANALPLYYFPMGEDGSNNFSTHPTLSRTALTLSPQPGANTVIQTSVAPPNAQGAVQWIPTPSTGSNSGYIAFGTGIGTTAPYATMPGGPGAWTYCFWKSYHGMASLPNNDKMWRMWPSVGVGAYPDVYLTHADTVNGNDAVLAVENNDNATNLPTANPGGGHYTRIASALNTWATYEVWFKENTFGNSDGVFNAADRSVSAWPQPGSALYGNAAGATTYGPCNSNNAKAGYSNNGAGPITMLFLDEYTNTGGGVPNGTTDFQCYGLMYFDDSPLQIIVSPESNYSTQWLGQTPPGPAYVLYGREIQIQTARNDTSVTFYVRQGSLAKGTPYSVYAVTGYATAILLGTGIYQ